MFESFNLPSYSNTYQGAWQGSRDAQQQQINTGAGMWQQLIAQQQQLANANNAGWQQLQSQIMGRLQGSNKANLQDIADQYTGFWGKMNQQMIDRGLANTTVTQSVERGVAADRAKEMTRSRGSFGQLMASALGQVGSQRLGAQMSSNSALANLGVGNINWLSGIGIGYPDRSGYQNQYGSGGGGGGGFMPPEQGMHRFPGDAIPMQYEGGYGGGGMGYSPVYAPPGASYGAAPQSNYSSGAGVGYGGEYDPSYATSSRYAFSPVAGGNYAQAQASGYGGDQTQATDYGAKSYAGYVPTGYMQAQSAGAGAAQYLASMFGG